jgi:23S rRNA G2445 N2-methylase RlmL
MRFLLTTDPGIETIVDDELADARPDAAIRPDPYASGGLVLVELTPPAPELLELATVHHVLELRHDAQAATLDDIRAAAREAALPELEHAASFRVTTERRGQHDFSTIDVQRAAGAVLHERFGTPVDLEQPALEVHVDLHGDRVAIGLRRTSRPLDARIHRSQPLRSALKPTLAAALIRGGASRQRPADRSIVRCGHDPTRSQTPQPAARGARRGLGFRNSRRGA